MLAGSSAVDEGGIPDGPFFQAQASLEASQNGMITDLKKWNDTMADLASLGLTAQQKALLKSIWYKPKAGS